VEVFTTISGVKPTCGVHEVTKSMEKAVETATTKTEG